MPVSCAHRDAVGYSTAISSIRTSSESLSPYSRLLPFEGARSLAVSLFRRSLAKAHEAKALSHLLRGSLSFAAPQPAVHVPRSLWAAAALVFTSSEQQLRRARAIM